ncbi:alkylated DNA repair protein alkB homolog 8-like isoform X2 [Vespula pensylvanica]|uniref:alkylated DNA repair protein alkB homolog 8-like isoform X2 n=1 Tax=Vespula pensylvanica TaxID=30213 RepID=UPI001CB9F6C3|nr:alkylated DNA repair protein alkB homolog 8-like isoform X2 [Vespula pensylvanica]
MELSSKIKMKSARKQKRAYHRLIKDMNIICCDKPMKTVLICNAGLSTGFDKQMLESIVNPIITDCEFIMPQGRSYCFIRCRSETDAVELYNKLHCRFILNPQSTTLYLTYIQSVPDLYNDASNSTLPPGLKLIEDFIDEKEEKLLLNIVDWTNMGSFSSDLKQRKVKHFGYEFQYHSNKVDPNLPIMPIPEECSFLQDLFKKHGCGTYDYDQLTINHYLPGQGIPPHIDTHSPFEDTILSLSLSSSCVMNFKKGDVKVNVVLPQRSLLVMTGEARYAWTHGISSKYSDLIETTNGVVKQMRGVRTSFTFRKVRRDPCSCIFVEYCDTKKDSFSSFIDNKSAAELERSYVHKVYNEISDHFSETRSKGWPNVIKFLNSLNDGALVVDVGCGNGKYLYTNENIVKIGCDRSSKLAEICRKRNFEVLLSDCLHLPYKDNSVDFAISIAVIHHLSTQERRKRAISEMIRILRPYGKCLIYVWAKDQNRNSKQSNYLKYNTHKKNEKENDECILQGTDQNLLLPIHKNRTEFTHSDMLVPWKKRTGDNFLRYYHLFEEKELSELCSEIPLVLIKDTYYDQGNWCIILEKNM